MVLVSSMYPARLCACWDRGPVVHGRFFVPMCLVLQLCGHQAAGGCACENKVVCGVFLCLGVGAGAGSSNAAKAYLQKLSDSGRYERDVWFS